MPKPKYTTDFQIHMEYLETETFKRSDLSVMQNNQSP